jgi:hypothetical protein
MLLVTFEVRREGRFISFEARRQRSSGKTAAEFQRTAAEFRRNGSRVPVKCSRQDGSRVPARWLRSFDEWRRSSGETAAEFREVVRCPVALHQNISNLSVTGYQAILNLPKQNFNVTHQQAWKDLNQWSMTTITKPIKCYSEKQARTMSAFFG